jgi:UDPglucose--hexose-1-phosphate uridylyltransferase
MMTLTDAFVALAVKSGAYEDLDRIYLENQLRRLVGQDDLSMVTVADDDLYAVIDAATTLVHGNGQLAKLDWSTEIFQSALCDYFTPLPSAVNRRFNEDYAVSPQTATDHFFAESRANDYIKVRDIAKNIAFMHPSQYGDVKITINLSKPEKDPKEIAAAKHAPQADFPKCQLCMENEGYLGRANHPARTNHRIVRFELGDEDWGFQYSPYAYYHEHAIYLNQIHKPMVIDGDAIRKILALVAKFPHYFAGSNADLPIVGGSILAHEHFQGGGEELPMARATLRSTFDLPGFENVSAGILNWPMSVIRLVSEDAETLVAASEHVLSVWDDYSDATVDIVDHAADGTRHHTITPISRMRDGKYELDLVLRDNHTTPELPDGVYHPHPDVQHIKKENIGLIEVMGLAILPPRLKQELAEVEAFVTGDGDTVADMHRSWAEDLRHDYDGQQDITEYVRAAVGDKFIRVLQDAGVFKDTPQGHAAFDRFIAAL